ncbi:hypothetical protein [Paraburkholderia sp. RL17-373-BIF-A]|uniref:hypothetical protein n=1 Tax=Paraburkholderia sp. RL17-373-BIF-A TaxID=3031629 RepID=UPI0038BD4ACA
MHGEKKHPLEIAHFVVTCLALLAAGAAAWFTHDQVKIAQDTEQRQLRAYVGIESVAFDTSGGLDVVNVVPQPDGRSPLPVTRSFFVVKLKNYGLTPARDIAVNFEPALFHGSGGIDPNEPFNDRANSFEMGNRSRDTLNAGQDTTSKILISGRNSKIMLFASTHIGEGLIVAGSLVYQDVFGKRWRNRYCYYVSSPLTQEQKFTACDQHNDEVEYVP